MIYITQSEINILEEKANIIINNLENKYPELTSNNFLFHKDDIYKKYPNFDEDYYKAKHEWTYNIQKALALGQITQKKAEELGWYSAIGESKIIPLPQILYHTTTNKNEVIKHGLKTRDELNIESGYGLGGGASDTISFTESLKTARNIKETLIEAQKVASGKTTLNKILEYSKSPTDTSKPFYDKLEKYYTINNPDYLKNLNEKKITEYSIGLYTEEDYNTYKSHDKPTKWKPLGNPLIGSDKKPRYNKWIINLDEDELRERVFDVYKKCIFWREHAGGKEDPLFFSSNIKALSKVNSDQIAVLQFKPKYNAHGYKMSALGEWRTYTGEAVEFINEVN